MAGRTENTSPERKVEARGGLTMPALGLGTWHMGESRGRRAEEVAALQLGLDLGMTLIDTAEMYADAELVVAEAMRGRRDEVFLVTKVLPSNASRKGTIRACEKSLKRLETECIDLYLLHWQGSYPIEETLEAFDALVGQGKIRHYGVSNFDTTAMEDVAAGPLGGAVGVNQVLYNLAQRGIEWDLLPWSAERQVSIMAYSPLDEGRLLDEPTLEVVARRHDTTPGVVAVAWTLRHPLVVSIPKASDPDHVRANAQALDLRFTEEDLADLDAAFPPPTRAEGLAIY